LYLERSASRELHNSYPVHVSGMLEQQLMIISVFLHLVVSFLLLRSLFLILDALNNAILVKLQLAI